jgi:hypothetical protein
VVVNILSRSLTKTEVEVLQKGPKFAPAPSEIPYKEIVANIEAGIDNLNDDSKEIIRNATASILDKAQLPANNVSKQEKRALAVLKKDDSIIITKADKGNCFVVMDRPDYDEKMQALLDDITTYETVKKNPFGCVERELNSRLLSLKKEWKLDDRTYNRLHSTDGLPPTIRGSVKHHKEGYPLRPIINDIGSALYNTSKYLTTILSPIQNNSVKNSTEFAREIKNIKIDIKNIKIHTVATPKPVISEIM